MDWTSFVAPAVVAALVSGVVSVVGFFVSARTARRIHTEKLKVDERLAGQRVTAEICLNQRKATADLKLAEAKWDLDRKLAAWKRRTEFAEQALSEFYEARDIILAARAPFVPAGEGTTRQKAEWETDEDARELNGYFAPVARLDGKAEFFARLHAQRYRFQALFGQKASEPYNEIFGIRHEIYTNVYLTVSQYRTRKRRGEELVPEKSRAIIWSGLEEDDIVARRLDAVIEAMETTCRSVLDEAAP